MNRLIRPVLVAGLCTVAACLNGCVIVAVDGDVGDGTWSSMNRQRARAIGVSLADVAPATAAQAGVDASRACIVTDVWSNSAADRAGIKKWDIVIGIDGNDRANPDALRDAIRARHGGDSLRLSLVRAGEKIETTVIVPGE